jgi:hypothetical protein
MQWFAFLWFQLQMTKQYLQEKTFEPAQSTADSANLNTPIGAGTPPGASPTRTPPMASAMKRRVSGSLSQNLFRLIGLPVRQVRQQPGQKPPRRR